MDKLIDINNLKTYTDEVKKCINDSNLLFVGTMSEFQQALESGEVKTGMVIVISDDEETEE